MRTLSTEGFGIRGTYIKEKKEVLKIEEKQNKSAHIEWSAPNRVYKAWDRQKFASIGTVIFFTGIFLVFFKQFWLLAVCLAFLFVAYALGTTAPREVTNKITETGIRTGNKSYSWEELRSFYFKKYLGKEVLFINTNINFPSRVSLVLDSVDKQRLVRVLSSHLTHRENPPVSLFDKFTDYMSKQLGL